MYSLMLLLRFLEFFFVGALEEEGAVLLISFKLRDSELTFFSSAFFIVSSLLKTLQIKKQNTKVKPASNPQNDICKTNLLISK